MVTSPSDALPRAAYNTQSLGRMRFFAAAADLLDGLRSVRRFHVCIILYHFLIHMSSWQPPLKNVGTGIAASGLWSARVTWPLLGV